MRTCSILLILVTSISLFGQDPAPPKKPSGPLADARKLRLRGNYDEARSAYGKWVEDAKHGVSARVGIVRSFDEEGKPEEALSAVDDALKKHPDHPDLSAEKARLLYRRGQWAEAVALADAALRKSKDHFAARWIKAEFARDSGDFAKADTEMRWFVRTYTQRDNDDKPITDPDELHLVGMAGAENARRHALGDQFKFIINELYPDAMKFDPDFWPAELEIGRLLLEKYNRPEAVQAFDNVLKINPKSADAYVGKGQVALQGYEFKAAEEAADQALKLQPKSLSAIRLKVDVLIMAGDTSAAEKLLTSAKSLNPRDEATLARIAALYRLTDRSKQIADVIDEVTRFNPKPSRFYLELAHAVEERKFYADAERYFKLSLEMSELQPGAKAGLGMLYLRLGNETAARELLDKAFDRDRFNVRVSNSLKVLRHLEKYSTIKTKHYELRFDPVSDQLLAEFLSEYLEEVHEQLAKDFQYQPQGLILVELFNNHEMFSGRTVGLPDLHTIGACTGKVVTMASPQGKGIVRPFNWGRVIRHELVHIFNLAQTEFLVPHWLTEGLAVRNEGGNRPPQWAATLRDRFEKDDLLNLDNILLAFVRPRSQEEWGLAYYQSFLYVEYAIKTYGIQCVGPLLDAFREGRDTAGALKKACRVDKADFEKGYRAYVSEIVRSTPGGAVRRKAEDKPMTLEELEKAQQADPKNNDLAASLADQYSRRRKTPDARKLVEEVLEREPGHVLASIVKARLLQLGGDLKGRQEVLEKSLEKHPDHPQLLAALGRFALDAKDYVRAAELLERGRRVAPLDGDWISQLVEVYTANEDAVKLKAVLVEQVGNDPDDLKSRLALGKMYLDAKDYPSAERIAWDAIRIDVTHADAQSALIAALTGVSKAEAAEKYRKRFATAKPPAKQ